MKIYSWNMWFSNTRFAEARTFIENSGADIFCLQEVPTAFIEELKALPYHLAYAPEVDRLFKGETSTQYIAILSRYPIRDVGPIELPYYEPHLPLRTKVFATLMVSIGLWGWGRGNRHALYADLETPRGGVRVFNSHLPLLAPRIRAEEFERIMQEQNPELPTILCGDLNILESRRISILSWILGGKASDTFFFRRERRKFEARFEKHGLTNPLIGKITHSISYSQLDHILVSRGFSVESGAVLRERYGSDHAPIRLAVTICP